MASRSLWQSSADGGSFGNADGACLGARCPRLCCPRCSGMPARNESTGSSNSATTLILATLSTTSYYVYALFMTRGEGYPCFSPWVGPCATQGLHGLSLVWSRRLAGPGAGLVRPLPSDSPPLSRVSSLPSPRWVLPSCWFPPRCCWLRYHSASSCCELWRGLLGGLSLSRCWALVRPHLSARVLACPPSDHPRLQRPATPGEAFRLAFGKDGRLALALRKTSASDLPDASICRSPSPARGPSSRTGDRRLSARDP